jgi:hypothetical protein
VGVLRFAALALVAPVFAMPGGAAEAADSGIATQVGAHAATTSRHGSDAVVRRTGPTTPTAGRAADYTGARGGDLHAPATIKLLAARLYWGDARPSYPTASRANRELKATAAYFERVSRGREAFHYTLTRWVHVDANADVMCGTQHRSVRAARAALTRAGYHLQHFNRLVLYTEQCNAAASMAQEPGHVTWLRFRNPGQPVLAHELGHNLGLDHAYGLVCRQGAVRVAIGGSCRSVEYGDDWDVMGHSRASFSVPTLARLGWAGRITTVRTSGTYQLADVESSGTDLQGLRIPLGGGTSYWVEYQPRHSTQIGRSIPGVTIRKQLPSGRVQLIDASPGNPTGIAFPDRDLTNPALPVGSSLTVGNDIRITTVGTGRQATVQVTYGQAATVPEAPGLSFAAELKSGDYRIHWTAPADNGQIVLGYRVTDQVSGAVTYVRSPAGYRTTFVLPARKAGVAPTFTVAARNQMGWSAPSAPLAGKAFGPEVTVTSPTADAAVPDSFDVSLAAEADPQTHSPPVMAWADVDRSHASCTSAEGSGPYTLTCTDVGHGRHTVVVHVLNSNGVTTDVTVHVRVTSNPGLLG